MFFITRNMAACAYSVCNQCNAVCDQVTHEMNDMKKCIEYLTSWRFFLAEPRSIVEDVFFLYPIGQMSLG